MDSYLHQSSGRNFGKEFYQNVINLFDRFINTSNDNLLLAKHRQGDLFLQAPAFLLKIFSDVLNNQTLYRHHAPNNLMFQGIEMHPTYEMAIVLFHKDYPLYGYDWMINKIPLTPPFSVKKEWYTETIVQIKEFYALGEHHVMDN